MPKTKPKKPTSTARHRRTAPQRDSVLQIADDIINGDRRSDYGSAADSFAHTAAIWNGLLSRKLMVPITEQDVAALMIGLKLTRLASTPGHMDSIVDIAGYAGCMEQVLEEGAPTLDGSLLHGMSQWAHHFTTTRTTRA